MSNILLLSENKLLADDLAEQINQIDRIVIKNHEAEIKLYKQEGVWRLDNPADVPVYQARVRSFLSALLEARFFEKEGILFDGHLTKKSLKLFEEKYDLV